MAIGLRARHLARAHIARGAPARLSTSTGWPSAERSFSASVRARVSSVPPGGKGTTMLTGRLG